MPILVSLPSGATPSERSAIRVALEGWQNAGLGIRFEEVAETSAKIEIRFAASPTGSEMNAVPVAGTGYTVTDCEFDAGWADREATAKWDERLPAHLSRAIVHLRRSNTDMLGQEVMLSVDELVGAALHELGHALGFPGHVATSSSVMAKSTDTVRRFGRRLLSEGRFAAPSLAALYALPSGTVVGRAQMSKEEIALFDAARLFAQSRNWRGPFVRVGERSANFHWLSGKSPAGRLEVRSYRASLESGAPFLFSASPLERELRTRQ